MSEEYRALVAKVAAFTNATEARRADAFACRRGCDACCQAWLSVSRVEAERVRDVVRALPADRRRELAARGRAQVAREAAGESPRCAMLDAAGGCSVYEGRPLVCRTQGHALRYPAGLLPEQTVRGRVGDGELTHCPLNYGTAPPRGEDVLDADRVDQILALVNLRVSKAQGVSSEERVSLSALAAEGDVLEPVV